MRVSEGKDCLQSMPSESILEQTQSGQTSRGLQDWSPRELIREVREFREIKESSYLFPLLGVRGGVSGNLKAVDKKKRSVNCSRFSFFYCPAGSTLAIAVGVGVARLNTHSLHLRLPLLLHSTLDSACLHIGIGRNLRLDGVPLNHLGERQGNNKKCQDGNTYEDYYNYRRHFTCLKIGWFRAKILFLRDKAQILCETLSKISKKDLCA